MREVTHGLTRHPLSAAWGDMPEEELIALSEDIEEHGQREPVVVIDGNRVLDGWHRAQACQMAGKPIRVRDFPEDGDPVAYVISKNRHRRHVTASQVAIAASNCVKWAGEGRPAKNPAPGAGFLATNAQIAKQAGVSERTVRYAKAAQRGGLGDAVANGDMSAKAAAEEVRKRTSKDKPPTPKRPSKLEQANERIAELEHERNEALATVRHLEYKLQTSRDAELSPTEQLKLIESLRAEVVALKSQCQEYMDKAASLQRRVNMLEKQQ